MIKIEKRLPFGFRGDWAQLYKKFDFDKSNTNDTIIFNKTNYTELGMDLQIKLLNEIELKKNKELSDFTINSKNMVIETTDAYFNEDNREFECVAEIDDIIRFKNDWWLVAHILEKPIYTPQKQGFYYLQLQSIAKEKINANKL